MKYLSPVARPLDLAKVQALTNRATPTNWARDNFAKIK